MHTHNDHEWLEGEDEQFLLNHVTINNDENNIIVIEEDEEDGELHATEEEVVPDEDGSSNQTKTDSDTRTSFDKLKSLVEKAATFSMIIGSSIGEVSHIEETVEKYNNEDKESSTEQEIDDSQTSGKKRKGNRGRIANAKKQKNTSAQEQISKMSSSSNTEGILVEQPRLLSGVKLRPYQLVGCNWLIRLYENGVNGILADEMGLGKTVQSISLLTYLFEKEIKGPFLVVAPMSTLSNWMNEFSKFAPNLFAILYHGTKDQRLELRQKHFPLNQKGSISKSTKVPNVIITSYDIAIMDKAYLKRFSYKYLIVDEAHRLKNFNCRLIRDLRQLQTENRLLLTGTPLQNNLGELWSLLNFLMPDLFDDVEAFEKWFDFSSSTETKQESVNEKQQLVSQLHKILQPFLLRRLKVDVAIDLPQKKEYIIYTTMTQEQKDYYEAIRKKDFHSILEKYNKDARQVQTKALLNILMQLRKVCNHPLLLNDFESKENESEAQENKRFVREALNGSGKFNIAFNMIQRFRANGHKILLFSLMTKMLDIWEDVLSAENIKFCRIDGTVDQKTRQQQIESFNSDPSITIFLISTRAGGLGINLTAADTVIIYDSDWNPQADLQAQDRCHRIGQTREVRVFRLISLNSVESKVLETARKKLNLERLIIQKGNFKLNQDKDKKLTVTAQTLLDILSSNYDKSTQAFEPICQEELNDLLDERSNKKHLSKGKGYELVVYDSVEQEQDSFSQAKIG